MRLQFSGWKFSQLGSDLRQVRRTIGFAAGIRDFLREQITPEQAKEKIKRYLDRRAERFLEVARTRIYARPASPYHRLLKLAGCEYADLCNHVRTYGLEKTLERLAGEGVYLTSDEYRGKREVTRRGESFRVVTADLLQADGAPGLVAQSSGSSNAPVRACITFDRTVEKASEESSFFSAHDLLSYTHAVYDGILPAGGGVN